MKGKTKVDQVHKTTPQKREKARTVSVNEESSSSSISTPTRNLSTSDFYFGSIIGEGSYGSVVHARSKKHKKELHPLVAVTSINNANCNGGEQEKKKNMTSDYSIKIMEKRQILREDKVQYIMIEKKILQRLNSDLVVKLHGSFHDADYLYLVLELCTGGDLSHYIKMMHCNKKTDMIVNKEDEDKSVLYYSGQILRALEFLHRHGIIHRDLKPQNILLTNHGSIKITDFGGAMDTTNPIVPSTKIKSSRGYDNTLVGTAEYISPEALFGSQTQLNPSVDIWAYGCIIYEILVGSTPFYSSSHYDIFQSVMSYARGTSALRFPEECVCSAVNQDFIRNLLCPDSAQRLGFIDDLGVDESCYHSIRGHVFFSNLSWDELDRNMINPPYKPMKPDWLMKPFPMRSTSSTSRDGSRRSIIEDWILEDDTTPLTVVTPENTSIISSREEYPCDYYEKEGEEKSDFF